jgi:hypothetical protein
MDIARLQEKLGSIPAPRRRRENLRHKQEDILVIGLAALLCSGEDFEDMEAFGLEREAELRKFLELPEEIPDESTFSRMFHRVNPKELSAYLYSRVMEAGGTSVARSEHRRENDTGERETRGISGSHGRGRRGPPYVLSSLQTKRARPLRTAPRLLCALFTNSAFKRRQAPLHTPTQGQDGLAPFFTLLLLLIRLYTDNFAVNKVNSTTGRIKSIHLNISPVFAVISYLPAVRLSQYTHNLLLCHTLVDLKILVSRRTYTAK